MQVVRLVVACACVVSIVKGQQCLEGGVPSSQFQKCYQFFVTTVGWQDASDVCNGINGRLVCLHSAFEQTLVFGNAKKQFVSGDYWIGLSDAEDPDVYVWQDGIDTSYFNWDAGYPLKDPSKRCVAAHASNGRWFNADCDNIVPVFVCEVNSRQEDPDVNCPAGGVYNDEHWRCLHFMNTEQEYERAQSICADIHGFLVNVNNDALQNFVYQEVQRRDFQGDYWIGLTHDSEKGTWVWSNESTFVYSHWSTGFPVLNAGLDCAAVNKINSGWYNTFCKNIRLCSVCETFPSGTPTEPPWNPEGWTHYNVTNAWYKFISDCYGQFGTCEEACVGAGGHLTSIHSQDEDGFVQGMTNVSFTMIGLMGSEGRSTDTKPSNWTWTDGSPVDYTNWLTGQPNGVEDLCVTLYDDGWWINVPCIVKVPAICKRSDAVWESLSLH